MRFPEWVGVFALTLIPCFAQKTPAEDQLEVLRDGLADPQLVNQISVLTDTVRRDGIRFDVGGRELGILLGAAIVGKRDPNEVAEFVVACLAACEQCRSRAVAPMTKEEIKKLTEWKFSEESILAQARARGVKEVEPSAAGVAALRESGASDRLIQLVIPDDRLVAPPISGYRQLALKHAEEYDVTAERGWLKVTAKFPASGYHQFYLRHTSLFYKPVESEEISEVGAYFNQPVPRSTSTELLDFKAVFDPLPSPPPQTAAAKPSRFRGKAAPAPKLEPSPTIDAYYEPQSPGGFNQFRIVIRNEGAPAQYYTFKLSWQVLTTPKPPPPQKPAAAK